MENQIYYGDNLDILRKYIADESIDLCYIDPPFNSNRNYNQIYNNIGKDDIAQSHAFVDTWSWNKTTEYYWDCLCRQPEYSGKMVDAIDGFTKILGKGSMLAYLVNMTIRIAEIHRVLKLTGTFYLHCDPTVSHYLKIILDSIFCTRGGDFRNEIIWCYRGAGYPKKDLGRRHDVIFRYAKSAEYTFNIDAIRESYAETTKARFKHHIGNIRKGVDFGLQKLNDLGKHPDDWWEIQPIAPSAKERLGYPTQKPLALLERIIKSSSNEGDVVLDAFCGCGTTVDAAQSLNRRWIGVDITYQAVSLILKRLSDRYGKDVANGIEISGIPRDLESAEALAHRRDDRLRKEFEKWAILTYADNQAKINDKKGADKGIDGVAYLMNGKAIFSVKSGKVTVKDVRDLYGVMNRENVVAGVLLTLREPTKQMREEAAAMGNIPDISGHTFSRKTPKLQIVTIEQLLDGERMNLPLTGTVVKSAQRNKNNNDTQYTFEMK
jgi:site-specific DNA-methyltransferase (adenine-specific)